MLEPIRGNPWGLMVLISSRQLVKSVGSLNEGILAAEEEQDAWPVVQRVISEVTGIKVEDIKKESRLYKDLKIG